MVIKNNTLLNAYATMAGLTYDSHPDVAAVSSGGFGTHSQIAYTLDDPNGFQATDVG